MDYLIVTCFNTPLPTFYHYRNRHGSEQENSKEEWFRIRSRCYEVSKLKTKSNNKNLIILY